MTHPLPNAALSTGRPPRRWRLRALLLLLTLALLAPPAALLWFSRPAELAQLLRDWTRSNLDAELTLGAEPRLGLWPNLHLELDAVAIAPRRFEAPRLAFDPPTAGVGPAAMRFAALRLVVPWSSAWSRQLRLQRIEIDAPQIDLAVFLPWIKGLSGSDQGPPAPIFLPEVAAPIAIHDGVLIRSDANAGTDGAADPSAGAIRFDLDSTALLPGQAFQLNLQIGEALNNYRIEFGATPQLVAGALELTALRVLAQTMSQTTPFLELSGSANLPSTQQIAFDLAGTLRLTSATASTTSTHTADAQALRLRYSGSFTGLGKLQLAYGQAPQEVAGELTLGELAGWWTALQDPNANSAALRLPPVAGTVRSDAWEVAGIKMRGLLLSVAPDQAASAPEPEAP